MGSVEPRLSEPRKETHKGFRIERGDSLLGMAKVFKPEGALLGGSADPKRFIDDHLRQEKCRARGHKKMSGATYGLRTLGDRIYCRGCGAMLGKKVSR